MNNLDQKIYVAGHKGMVGSAIIRALKHKGYSNIISRTHEELDLTNQAVVHQFFEKEKPSQVYLAAAKVGGIYANNNFPAEFIYNNLMIQNNLIHASWINGVKKLLFLGSSCIYPKLAKQPMREDALLSGYLEATNEPYAVAKIAGIKLCESYNRQYETDFRSIMPSNLYGPGDSYHSENSHVIPSLIRRFHEAKVKGNSSVTIWGSGKSRREFLYVEDMADAAIFVMELDKKKYQLKVHPMRNHINVGFGSDLTVYELAMKIKKVIEFKGEIKFDLSRPDGAPQKLMSSMLLNKLGWQAKTELDFGLDRAYQDFLLNYE
jgi:GDP-L-fucose synthase